MPALLSLQLPTNVPGEAAERGPGEGPCHPPETRVKLQVLGLEVDQQMEELSVLFCLSDK